MAEFYKWDTETLGLKIKEMDDEHQILINLMNQLHEGYVAKKSFTELKKMLTDLSDYTHKHFADEEKYMEKISYPGLATHKLIHKSLLEQLAVHADKFKKNQTLTEDLFKFLSVWLTSHIRGIDMKYSGFAHEKPSAKKAA